MPQGLSYIHGDKKSSKYLSHFHLRCNSADCKEVRVYLLSQAQRDYFGAHTYELLSKPGHFVHTNWTGHGGSVSSTTYQA